MRWDIGPRETTLYSEVAAGGPETMLFIEGLSAQLLGWRDEFCEKFVEAGYTVVRLDNRDAGLSPRFPGQAYTLADMADDVVALLDALDIESAHIVGQSMGGMIAQELVLRDADRVRSLGLLYTAPSMAYANRDIRPTVQKVPATREEAIEQYLDNERICSTARYPMDEGWKRRLGGMMWDRGIDPFGTQRQGEAMMRSGDRTVRLTDILVPTVLIHGTEDALIRSTASEVLAEHIDDATLLLLDGMGHSLPVELWPDIVGAILTNASRAPRTR